MNVASVVVVVLIVGLAFLAVRHNLKKKKGCGCGCAGCSGTCSHAK